METNNLLKDILGHDNAVRQRAETTLNDQRTQNPAQLLQLFTANISNSDPAVAQIACILFKKYFLDNRDGIQNSDFEQMKQVVIGSIDF